MTQYIQKKECRICGNRRLIPILDLGRQPLANRFLRKSDLYRKEPRFPLAVQFCDKCSLLSLRHVVNPQILFSGYRYQTGASAPLVVHFEDEARMIVKRFIRSKNDLVVEFGSNDGELLAALKNKCRVLGVDPAKNLAAVARKKEVPTLSAFFGEQTAQCILRKHGQANIIIANNVFAHIDALHDCMRGVTALLREDGVFISESHWVSNLIGSPERISRREIRARDGGFDQIYHEHLSYYSLHALAELARMHGLVVTNVELFPIHGASIRVYMQKQGQPNVSVRRLLAREKKLGLTRATVFQKFARRVEETRIRLRLLIRGLARAGKTIAGYGAPAKGNTLLNYCRLGTREIAFITDTTFSKQGFFAPGTHIPVISPDVFETYAPDYLLLLAWNYADAILEKEKRLRKQGVKFIIPVPRVKVV